MNYYLLEEIVDQNETLELGRGFYFEVIKGEFSQWFYSLFPVR